MPDPAVHYLNCKTRKEHLPGEESHLEIVESAVSMRILKGKKFSEDGDWNDTRLKEVRGDLSPIYYDMPWFIYLLLFICWIALFLLELQFHSLPQGVTSDMKTH